jgi:hypothetical protein
MSGLSRRYTDSDLAKLIVAYNGGRVGQPLDSGERNLDECVRSTPHELQNDFTVGCSL